MRRALVGLTNVALFTVTCWLVSVMFNEILAERLQPRGVSLRAGETRAPEETRSWGERKVIIDRNLFGAKVARQASKAPPPVEVKEEVEETKLPLKLQGTLWSSDPALSTAAIHDTGKRIEQVLAVGDSLEERNGVEVAAIERGRVILLNGSRREELLLSEEGDPRERGPRARGGAAASRAKKPAARARVSRPSKAAVTAPPRARRSTPPTEFEARYNASKRAGLRKQQRQDLKKAAKERSENPKPAVEYKTEVTNKPVEKSPGQKHISAIIESMGDSGASPDEIIERMREFETRKASGDR